MLTQVHPELREALAEALFSVLPMEDVSADLRLLPEPPPLSGALRDYPRAGGCGLCRCCIGEYWVMVTCAALIVCCVGHWLSEGRGGERKHEEKDCYLFQAA
jgi:hypothetical protein